MGLIHISLLTSGVIDRDYRGNVTALLQNFSNVDFRVTIGDRICQAILEKINMADILVRQVRSKFFRLKLPRNKIIIFLQELPNSPRNNGSFGSTGIKRFRKDEDDGLGGDGGDGSGDIVHSSQAAN